MPGDPRHRAGKTTKTSRVGTSPCRPVSLELCPRIQGRPEPPVDTIHQSSSHGSTAAEGQLVARWPCPAEDRFTPAKNHAHLDHVANYAARPRPSRMPGGPEDGDCCDRPRYMSPSQAADQELWLARATVTVTNWPRLLSPAGTHRPDMTPFAAPYRRSKSPRPMRQWPPRRPSLSRLWCSTAPYCCRQMPGVGHRQPLGQRVGERAAGAWLTADGDHARGPRRAAG